MKRATVSSLARSQSGRDVGRSTEVVPAFEFVGYTSR
jgi:hypothetical protein